MYHRDRTSNRAVGEEPSPLRCPLCSEASHSLIFEKDDYLLVKCRTCGLVYVANPPPDSDITSIYSFSSGYHIELVDRDASAIATHSRTARRYLSLLAAHRSPGRILDVGCSVGVFLETVRAAGWEAYGVELSEDSAAAARARGLNVATGTLASAGFPTENFDAITFWDVLEHLRDPLGALLLANKLLVRDGILALSTPNVDGIFPRISLRTAPLTRVWRHPEPPYHLVQFSKKTIRYALRLAGFEILETIDRRIPLSYTFGRFPRVVRSPKRLAYAALFAPLALIGPGFSSGDEINVVARKVASPRRNA
jgi:2-polyprenyl-3-methyl-5-hydroxy-6-metoxy-1,4-benzoquinol methylase